MLSKMIAPTPTVRFLLAACLAVATPMAGGGAALAADGPEAEPSAAAQPERTRNRPDFLFGRPRGFAGFSAGWLRASQRRRLRLFSQLSDQRSRCPGRVHPHLEPGLRHGALQHCRGLLGHSPGRPAVRRHTVRQRHALGVQELDQQRPADLPVDPGVADPVERRRAILGGAPGTPHRATGVGAQHTWPSMSAAVSASGGTGSSSSVTSSSKPMRRSGMTGCGRREGRSPATSPLGSA